MKLIKITFDKLEVGDECIFRAEGKVVHCEKASSEQIYIIRAGVKDTVKCFTGQFHEVWRIT